jgi:hypothetical protein
MVKNILSILIIGLLGLSSAFAQNIGNEWINYSQKYYKFKVVENGVYRIPYTALVNAGVPLTSISNPKNFQVFGRGEEVHIYVHNESTGVFSPGDYIEFYAQKNTGWYDSVLYKSPDHQSNKEYSLFTDTAVYFFTWNNQLNNNRLTLETDVNYSAYNASNWFWAHNTYSPNYSYLEGVPVKHWSSWIVDPEYVEGEGWYDYPLYLGGSRTRNVSTKNVYSSGPQAKVSFDVFGASDFSALAIDHHLRVEFAGLTIDSLYGGYKLLHFNYQIPNSSLGSSNTSFKFSSINDLGSGADRFAVSFINVEYPHTPNLESKTSFRLFVPDASGQSKTYLNLSSFSGGSYQVFYDLTNNKRVQVTSGSSYQVLIPNSGEVKECFISGSAAIHTVSSVEAVGNYGFFTNYITQNPNVDYVIISHNRLMGNASQSTATDYAAYRNTTGNSVLLVDVENLYDQYSYGIRKNPLAIRNFVRALGDQYGYNRFKGLFLIGKSYRAQAYRKDVALFDETLVPTMGNPPSDILLTAGLVDNFYTPAIPTGRLAARNIDHVDLYLNKMMIYEDSIQNPANIWKKRIMHFSGGSTKLEQDRIANYLRKYKKIAQDTFFGAKVITIEKTTTDPIQINLSDLIKSYINNGVSLMTFFGHAAGIGFDISIDNPSEYENYGKYPFLIANSCYAGDIFQVTNSGAVNSSEEFVLIRDKGMIGYLASVTPASEPPLDAYSTAFYNNFSHKYYGKSVGYIIQKIIESIQTSSIMRKEICLEMTLHGDPALAINSARKPDYYINQQSVFYNPSDVTTAVDSFDFNLVISNKGRAVGDSMIVSVRRKFPVDSAKAVNYKYRIVGTKYKDTLTIRMPILRSVGVGFNTFFVDVDQNSEIMEMDETNNNLTIVLNIKSADLTPVYPTEFAIVPTSQLTLKASTYYPFTNSKTYVFEIDTTDKFNSPSKEVGKVTVSGGVIEWKPNQVFTNNRVYYWRVSIDSNATTDFNWRASSFQYVQGKTGWSQAHFYQYKNDNYQFVKYMDQSKKFEFVNDKQIITVQNGKVPHIAWTEIWLKFNNSIITYYTCMHPSTPGLKFLVFNPVSAEPWLSYKDPNKVNYGTWDNVHCRSYPIPAIEFPTATTTYEPWGAPHVTVPDTVWWKRTEDFLAKIPQGHYVIVMSDADAKVETYPEDLYKAFDTLGFNIRSYQNDRPFVLYSKKGFGAINMAMGTQPTDVVFMKDSMITNWNAGFIKSPIIGPSLKWNSLHWKQHSIDNYPSDSIYLQLVGIKSDGTVDTIINGIPPDSMDVLYLNSRMDAKIYPYCQMIVNMKDDSLRTPGQMEYWQVLYETVPELALTPKKSFSFYNDTIMQGDTVKMTIAYSNISDVNADSVLVSYWVTDIKQNVIPIATRRIAPISKNSFIVDTIKVETTQLLGQCYLHVDINTFNSQKGSFDQLEQSHINNTGDYPFYVQRDNTNPLLDVTFDGVHIIDGDIVSAKPEILISLRDDSKLRAIEDTSSFKIYIKGESDPDYRYISFQKSDILEFIPADLPDNTGQVIYRPSLMDDGEYELMVQARDASYNQSGKSDLDNFYIKFKIINKSTITEVMNWPNPFSTKTHFVFTLTGSQLPDYFKIQIMTVTGKVVREIDMDELGPLHIGRNITEYAWDGHDDFGDQLANGVYLYRVVTRLNGESIELNQTQASQYFTKSFGKMYLMR